ncbi:MAG: FAD-binding oxidoreductase [Pigmentiphaga sp.]|uniref:FAD-binding oxidoreductase n=1 Tax=Pigmentiphaga sp. TaxID=1977564 RepID=UPI0029AA0640|nr:FAD-binding oxidoreductase [Pigmentiphaga sp.]MDX3905992.1 FAD-binding oxidoreductase [Pigmentiphaga sp.]
MSSTSIPDLHGALAALVGEAHVYIDAADKARYETGARYGNGRAALVVRPGSTAEVAAIVRHCVQSGVPLIAQGANTGLVAASTPDESGSQVVLSLERLRGEIAVDRANRTATVGAGVTLQELNDKLAEHGLCFPIDLGANPSLGGMIATNTGGSRLIRYGDVRHNLLGVEVVLADPPGQVVDLMSGLRKNNTGYDLKQLFVGVGGAGGVITRAVVQVHPLPRQTATALIVPTGQEAILDLLIALEGEFGDFLTAYEGMSRATVQSVIDHVPGVTNPFAPDPIPDYCLLVELAATSSREVLGVDLQSALNDFLERQFDVLVANAVLDGGPDLWKIRHSISESIRHQGKLIAFDIAVPRSSMVAFRHTALQLLERDFPWLRLFDFGHWADGGTHFNIVWPHDASIAYDPEQVERLRVAIYDLVVREFGGSFSAEHGVGPYNERFYHRYASPETQALAGRVQQAVDPRGALGQVWYGPPPTR